MNRNRYEEVADCIDRGVSRRLGGLEFDYAPAPRMVFNIQDVHVTMPAAPAAPPVPAEPEPTTAEIAFAGGAGSFPVWTAEVEGMIFTIILVNNHRRYEEYQLYAVDRTWSLVGMFGLYADALAEVQTWRVFLSKGGTLASWKKQHPHGIVPKMNGNH